MKTFEWLKILNSPFVRPRVNIYAGRIAVGTPYFFPRRTVKDPDKPGYLKFIPRRFGFDFVGLGFKTKWTNTDYRFEWSPIWSFVFWKWQIAVTCTGPRGEVSSNDAYWESWLYYTNDTKGTKKERVEQCKKDNPKRSTIYRQGQEARDVDYYNSILKRKYR